MRKIIENQENLTLKQAEIVEILSEDGKVTKGLDEQLKSLQESKSFLFVPEKQQPTFRGWNPAGGADSGTETSDVGSNFAKIANDKGSSDASNNPWG